MNAIVATAQGTSSAVEIVTTYSQNEKFYLKSIPYDNEFPSLRGKTLVFENGNPAPRYVFERGFDSVTNNSNNLILSNTGEVIFFAIFWGADESKEGMKSITLYKNGKVVKSFTETDITGCDNSRERCSLVYSNYDQVVDEEKSNWGTNSYRKAFKKGTDDKERFLSDFPLFSFDDTVYLTDSKKRIHLFDLKEGSYLRSASFDDVFEQIRGQGRLTRTETSRYDAPIFLDFPNLKNGKDSYQSLADYIGMKPARMSDPADEQYKQYRFKLDSYILPDGSLQIEGIEIHDDLPKEKILQFFKSNKFDSSSVPKIFDMWYMGDEYFYFRKASDSIARQEKQEEILAARQEREKRMTLETINSVYIPKNLGECLVELDRLLTEIDRKEMEALSKKDEMIRYHMGLGMWMRNNWGLWSGSRLQKYFTEKGITHPDEMSSVVLFHYYDWLHGKKESWKDWDKKPNKTWRSEGTNPQSGPRRAARMRIR